MTDNIYNGSAVTTQDVYDAFNGFIMSPDVNVFNKMMKRAELFNYIKNLPGDIVECGVFKGSGILTWLKLNRMYCPNGQRKVIGFDFFEPQFTQSLSDADKNPMDTVLNRAHANDLSIESVTKKIKDAGFSETKFKLVPGDLSDTSRRFVDENIGFRIALLYMDVDIEKPTYDALINMWDRIVPGGIVVFDEYAYHCWSESNGVDKFIREKGLKLNYIDCHAPTAYIVKH